MNMYLKKSCKLKTVVALMLIVAITMGFFGSPVAKGVVNKYQNLNTGGANLSTTEKNHLDQIIDHYIMPRLYVPSSFQLDYCSYYASQIFPSYEYFLITFSSRNRIGGLVTNSIFVVFDSKTNKIVVTVAFDNIVYDGASTRHFNSLLIEGLKYNQETREYISEFSYPWSGRENTSIGWKEKDGKWYYYVTNYRYATGWKKIDGVWYYFKSNGEMATGWINDGNTRYFMEKSGKMKTGWLLNNGNWYYLDASGIMARGWRHIDNIWYYFNATGVMVTGWLNDNGTWYHFNGSGAMETGWIKNGNNWYYLESSGAMATGWRKLIENKKEVWYYFDPNGGAMATDWLVVDGKWEFFAPSGAWQYTWNG